LSSVATSAVEIKSEATFDDFTTLHISLSGLTEIFVPIYLKIDWGDGENESFSNTLHKVYRKDSILNEVMYGKFSSIFSGEYAHTYYPSSTARYKNLSAQIYVEYSDGSFSWFVQPIKIVTRDYFESIYDIKMLDTNILPVSSNRKIHHFSIDEGGFLIEMI
jgi:hypothetical protein